MKTSIAKWFAPPVFEGDETKTRRASFVNAALLMTLSFLGITIPVYFFDGTTRAGIGIILSALFFVVLLLYSLLRCGKVMFAGSGMMLLEFLAIFMIELTNGTVRAPVTLAYMFVIITAGMLFEWRGILVSVSACSLVLAGLILAENAGMLPHPDYAVTLTNWITYTVLFGVTGGVSVWGQQTAQQALARAEQEIKARERVEVELRKLSLAVEQSPASIVITNLEGSIEYVNPRFMKVTGYGVAEATGKNPRILKTGKTLPETYRQLWETITSGKEWRGEFANRKKDGSLYYESAIISPITDQKGIVTHYLAVKEDITERRQAEETVNRRNQELATLYETSLQINSISDVSDLMHITIQRACDLLKIQSGALYLLRDEGVLELLVGYHVPQSWIGKKIRSDEGLAGQVVQSRKLVMVPDYLTWQGRLSAFEDSPARRTLGIPLRFRDQVTGVVIFMDTQVGSFSDEDIRLVNLFIDQAAIAIENARLYASAQHEIAERRQVEIKLSQANDTLEMQLEEIRGLQDELREQAIHDPLTGVFNRRYLNETLAREIARAGRENNQLSVIMSDIDHFKIINDTYGHPVGDKFLVAVASLMKNHARGSDIVCRYGGEEFLLVLPGTALDSAAQRAEEIRQMCAEVVIKHEGQDLKITMSFGVATHPDHGKEADEIIIKADKAMYQSKHTGRNRVTAWGW
jgi:diguanylate cyclase (GGDEF)-like protein/PAS domain S-box-containing protein